MADITIDATQQGAVHMSLEVRGVQTDRPFHVKRHANPEEYAHSDVRMLDGQGNVLTYKEKGPRYIIDKPPQTVVVEYKVVPGGVGRHGSERRPSGRGAVGQPGEADHSREQAHSGSAAAPPAPREKRAYPNV